MKLILIATFLGCSVLDPEVGDLSPPIESGPPVIFGRDIRPLMNRSPEDPTGHGCASCHYSTETIHNGLSVSGLDLATLGSLRKGGINTQHNIVLPYDPGGSAIVQKLRGTFPGMQMPKNGPAFWSEDEIELVETWIAQGAKGDDTE